MPNKTEARRLPFSAALLVLAVLFVLAAYSGPHEITATGPDHLAPTGSMETARSAHTATLLAEGTVLVTGGFSRNRENRPFASAEIYNPDQGGFTPTGAMNQGRQSHTAIRLRDGTVLIVGGYAGTVLASTERYDPETGTFVPGPNLNEPRMAHRAVVLSDGRMLLIGGIGRNQTRLASAELYDPSTNTFTATGAMTTPRAGHTATLLNQGQVLITGGSDRRGTPSVLASAEVYDLATGTFKPTGPMTTARHKHGAALLDNGRVVILAGSDARDGRGLYRTAEVYDPAIRTFSPTHQLNTRRFKHQAAVVALADGRVLVAGGAASAEVYDPDQGRFDKVRGAFDEARFFSVATQLRDGRVLITGGYNKQIESTARAWLFAPHPH